LEIWRQVFGRSVRMGKSYVVLSLAMGCISSFSLNYGGSIGNVVSNAGNMVDLGAFLGLLVIPLGALVGLVITTPVYLLYVNDKNSGVLEYLLAVGMDQREIFAGYLKAALALSLVSVLPVVLIEVSFENGGIQASLVASAIALVTSTSDVALVTVLMTAFSSMQRSPTGMNSPLGISIGVLVLVPELLLLAVLGTSVIWVDMGTAVAVSIVSVALLVSIASLVRREKLLP
jgi:hypothetical protein